MFDVQLQLDCSACHSFQNVMFDVQLQLDCSACHSFFSLNSFLDI